MVRICQVCLFVYVRRSNYHMCTFPGIFPEGGSHDQTEILALKGGIAKMALGACAKYEGLNVTIVPVGLNYYRGHR